MNPCPKCDCSYDGQHCCFCGFVPTRKPTAREKRETRQCANFKQMNRYSGSEYSIDDYTIKQINMEESIWEVR